MIRQKQKDGTTLLTEGGALAVYPVGSIYLTVNSANPSTYFGGTWVAWGSGRVPVGVNAGDAEFDAVEETGGSKTNVLAAGNLPPHAHTINHGHDILTHTSGGAGGTVVRGQAPSTAQIPNPVVDFAGSSGNGPGASTPVNNLQPYITCYMWKRTA